MASSGSWYSLTVLCCDTWRQQKNSWKKASQNISISSWSVRVCVCVCVCTLGRRENGSHRPGYKGLQQSGACRLPAGPAGAGGCLSYGVCTSVGLPSSVLPVAAFRCLGRQSSIKARMHAGLMFYFVLGFAGWWLAVIVPGAWWASAALSLLHPWQVLNAVTSLGSWRGRGTERRWLSFPSIPCRAAAWSVTPPQKSLCCTAVQDSTRGTLHSLLQRCSELFYQPGFTPELAAFQPWMKPPLCPMRLFCFNSAELFGIF